MDATTKRFLDSIHFENAESIDLLLTHYKKDFQGQWSYYFLKQSPWDFDTLDHLLSLIQQHVKYPLEIIFSYSFNPQIADAIDLFHAWFMRRSYMPCPFIVCEEDAKLKVKFNTEALLDLYRSTLDDFSLLLSTIQYPFTLEAIISDEKQEEEEEDFDLGVEVPVSNEDEIPPPPEEMEPPSEEAIPTVVMQHSQDMQSEWEKNFERMKKERAEENNREYRVLAISEINENSGLVDFDGVVFSTESRKTRKGSTIFTLGVGKNGDGIFVKVSVQERQKNKYLELKKIKVKQNVRVKGKVELNEFSGLTINANTLELLSPDPLRDDPFSGPLKRIELHAHTKMSVMDGIGDMKGYLELAKNMGHTAFAVTDHGVVQAFPDAQEHSDKTGVKVIYGAELYMIDTKPTYIENPSPISLNAATYCIFDFETTGLSARYDRIIEFGAVRVEKGMITKRMDILINPGKDVVISKKSPRLPILPIVKLLINPPSME